MSDAHTLGLEVKDALSSAMDALGASLDEAIKQAGEAGAARQELENARNELDSVKAASEQLGARIKTAAAGLLDRLEDLGFADKDIRARIEGRIAEEPSGAFKLAMQAIDLTLGNHESGSGVEKEAPKAVSDPDGWGAIRTKGA